MFTIEHADVVHQRFERALEIPAVVVRVVVVWGYEYGDSLGLGCFEKGVYVLHGVVGFDALANHAPGDALGTQEVILRIGHDQRGAALFDLHAGIGQCGKRV